MASSEYVIRGPPNTFDAEMGSTKPNKQAKQILKSGFILLNAPQGSENSKRAGSFGLTFQSPMVRSPRTPAVLVARYRAGSIGSMFPASRQDVEGLKDRFVAFCQ